MKTKIVLWLVTIIIIVLVSIQQWIIYSNLKNKDPEISNYELLRSLDSLKNEISSLKIDSLQSVVDTTKVTIIKVEKRYETIRNRIINQSMDSDCVTFANYISNNQRRLTDSINSKAAKNIQSNF